MHANAMSPNFSGSGARERCREPTSLQTFTKEMVLPNCLTAVVTYTVVEKPVLGSKSGIILRFGGNSTGRPHLFGLEHDEMLSDRSRPRAVSEINTRIAEREACARATGEDSCGGQIS